MDIIENGHDIFVLENGYKLQSLTENRNLFFYLNSQTFGLRNILKVKQLFS